MVTQHVQLISDFLTAASTVLNQQLPANLITHAMHQAPHNIPRLPEGSGAVYVFSLPAVAAVPAGPNRVLKVGKAGARAAPRFQYHHYGVNAPSTLAKAIHNNQILWAYIGYPGNAVVTGDWMKQSLDRDSFFVAPCLDQDRIIGLLEVFVKARLGPVYEGSLKG